MPQLRFGRRVYSSPVKPVSSPLPSLPFHRKGRSYVARGGPPTGRVGATWHRAPRKRGRVHRPRGAGQWDTKEGGKGKCQREDPAVPLLDVAFLDRRTHCARAGLAPFYREGIAGGVATSLPGDGRRPGHGGGGHVRQHLGVCGRQATAGGKSNCKRSPSTFVPSTQGRKCTEGGNSRPPGPFFGRVFGTDDGNKSRHLGSKSLGKTGGWGARTGRPTAIRQSRWLPMYSEQMGKF